MAAAPLLAVLAALLGAGVALALTFCLCAMPPLAPEFVALYKEERRVRFRADDLHGPSLQSQ